ncbi:hypothetical protein Q5P01_024975 [Channa striata]|uniref:Uncharacterized protein n=1 Tax=Channa striata TaxID=64152 RepID=A0AA88LQ26_CHASR|nr:hypothetical protein Q5P01_024975 [Channa striata]
MVASFWGNRKGDRDFWKNASRDIAKDTAFVEGLLDYWEDDAAEAPRYGAVRPIRSVRKSLPADASDSEGQKRATGQGVEEGRVTSVYPEPENRGRIASSSIMSVAGRADRHNLILPKRRASHAAHG